MWGDDPREKSKFVFNLLDIDGDGIISGPDLTICQEDVDMDSKFGQEIQFLLDHYVRTQLRIRGRPNQKDIIRLDFYINCLTSMYGKNGQSCLI